METRQLTSQRLTRLYLDRLQRFNPKLNCIITLTNDLALSQAQQADREIASGHYRGPLHGIPWGGKDLLDTAGIATTYGAEPYRNRVPPQDAVVVKRLHDAGAVLVAKLSLGALALNDIWFGGQTVNPWLLEEGAAGSSAGPGAATAAGLVGFAIGSETGGSLIDPAMRCGVSALRPTYGRVPRTGAMTLCWSLDKLGPMARGVEDGLLVLQAISAPTRRCRQRTEPAGFRASAPVYRSARRLLSSVDEGSPRYRCGSRRARRRSETRHGSNRVSLPDWPYDSLQLILFAEAAAAFEDLTLSGGLNRLKVQVPDAWPNSFRQARFLSAVDFVQADAFGAAWPRKWPLSFRKWIYCWFRRCATKCSPSAISPAIRPSLSAPDSLSIGGRAAIGLRTRRIRFPNFRLPGGCLTESTLIGRLFDEGTIGRAALALERSLNVSAERPPGFS